MKTRILLSLLLLSACLVHAQRDGQLNDTTRISIVGKELIITNNGVRRHVTLENQNRDRYTEWNTAYSPSYDSEPSYLEPVRHEYDDKDYPCEKPNKIHNNVQVKVLAMEMGFTNYYDHRTGAFGKNAVLPQLEVSNARLGSHIALHIMPTTVRLAGNFAVNLETALTLDFTQYYYTQPYVLKPFQPSLSFENIDAPLKVNKLETRYFQVPLMISFRTHPVRSKGVGIAFGGYAGARIFAKTKQTGDEYGKVKVKDDFNTNPFRYGLAVRVHIAWLQLYGYYNLNSLFDPSEGPQTQSFMAGVRLFEF